MPTYLPEEVLHSLRALDTCVAADAIESFDIQLRNEGYTTSNALHCRFPNLPPMLGYAVTVRVRSANPPMEGGVYRESPESWAAFDNSPIPQVVVIQDMDGNPGVGALVGELHATVLRKMGCAGVVTNGAIRDLPGLRRLGLPVFSASVSPSHAYIHVLDIGKPVEVAGLIIHAGELLLGDCHGIVRIPLEIAAELARESARIAAIKQDLLAYCGSPNFSVQEFRERVKKSRG